MTNFILLSRLISEKAIFKPSDINTESYPKPPLPQLTNVISPETIPPKICVLLFSLSAITILNLAPRSPYLTLPLALQALF